MNVSLSLSDTFLDELIAELRQTLPSDAEGRWYRVADDADDDYWFIAQAGMVFPFSFDVHGERARKTLTHLRDACRTRLNWSPGSSPEYKVTHWMWTTAYLATAFFYQGRADEGYAVLCQAPASAGPFLAPNEHFRDEGGARLSWFTTGAGAVVHAIHAMFVQVDEDGTILLPALPSARCETPTSSGCWPRTACACPAGSRMANWSV